MKCQLDQSVRSSSVRVGRPHDASAAVHGASGGIVPGVWGGRARGTVLAIALLSLGALIGFRAVRADAAGGPELLVQFGPTGSGAGQTTNPRGVATDPATGHVYVADLGNQRISEFNAWGQFVRAFGWGVADGTTAALQTCTATCFSGLNGDGAGEFSNPLGLAVDSSGNVYVAEFSNHRVQKFNSAGEFLLMFGGEVNKTTGEDVCTKAQLEVGNVCGVGTTGTTQGQFGDWRVGSFIAVGPTGIIYVGDVERIEQFNSDGTFKAEISLPGDGTIESLAVDPSGNLYIRSSVEGSPVPGVHKLSSSGSELNSFATSTTPKALATDSAGNLYMVDGEEDPVVRKFNSSGVETASFGEGEFTRSTGIGTNTAGDVYVSNFEPENSYIRAYGPLPTAFEPPPSASPTIGAEYAASAGTAGAVVKAEVNPHFFPTTYYVQYGSADCEVNPCAEQPASPGAALAGERDKLYSAGVSLGGLTPGTTYHYRFVAVNEADTVFGPDRTFRTYRPGAFALPDGRAFEMVSPPDKHNAEVGVPGNTTGLVDIGFSVKPLQASMTGEAIAYPSFTSFGDAQSAPTATTYLSKRGTVGWSTENITPPNQEGYTRDPFRGFSGDLSFGTVIQKEPILAPGAAEGFENLYLRDNGSGTVRALTTGTPRTPDAEHYCVGFAGASANFDHVIFTARGALTPEASEAPGFNLYEWSAGQLSLVSKLEGGAPAQPSETTGFGAGSGSTGNSCKMNQYILRNAISADGSQIFWTYAPSGGGATRLLARLDGTDTIQLDAPQGGPGPAGGGKFWAASNDGSKVFFTDPNELTLGASLGGESGNLGDLYEYNFDAEPGEELTDLTIDPSPGSDPPAVQGVLGASEDGSYIYFVAEGKLTGEEENANHEKAQSSQNNLYAWHEGDGLRFIATLSATDAAIGNNTRFPRFSGLVFNRLSGWSSEPSQQTARVTPDGRHLAFMSVASLTGYDNIDQGSGEPVSQAGEPVSQVYLYDAPSGELVCASCNPSGARPIGFSELPVWITPYEQPRYLSDGGERLFFLSFDALALNDTNGQQDVYEFERDGVGGCTAESAAFSAASGGCVYLVSSGNSGDWSYFLDASADGRDVFLSSRQRLAPADEDERFDVYDARIAGGFAPRPSPPAICAGEACRPTQAPPEAVSPASAGFVGEGNVKGERKPCPRGKRRMRRHGRTKCVKNARGRYRAHNHRRAGR